MSSDELPGQSIGFVRKNLKEVQLLCGVVLEWIVGLERSLKLRFEKGVFGDLFGDDVGVSSFRGLGADTPGDGRVVTEEPNVHFCGVFVCFSFDSSGGEEGRRRSGPGPVENLKIEFSDVKMSKFTKNNFGVEVQGFVPVNFVGVLRGRRDMYGGVGIGDSYPIWL